MKKLLKFLPNVFVLSTLFLGLLWSTNTYSQEEPRSVRLSSEYIKVMDDNSYLKISANYKGENGYQPCSGLSLNIYSASVNDTGEMIPNLMGKLTLSDDGKGKFTIPSEFVSDSSTFLVKIENQPNYADDETEIIVKNASISAVIEEVDSVQYIKARIVNANDEPIAEVDLQVGLKRLFGNLPIGEEEFYTTDEDGQIEVEIGKGYTGKEGKLVFEVSLNESDEYGTVIGLVNADFGVPIEDKSTFDQRTMWGPPSKTPLYILIFPNLILVGIWSIIVFLIFNLFKIYKSN